MDRQRFPGITADAFVSANDKRALEALKKIPLLPKVIQKFYELGIDRWMYCHNIAMCVRCGPKQFKTLYGMFQECCDIFDMPEPELYVTSNPFPNAFAGGVERPYVIVRCSMIDTLTDEQMYHLLGHELGHIKAGHVLYTSVASVLAPLLDHIGRRTFGLGDAATIGLLMAMAEWSRQSEISADRAGLLCGQSLENSLRANMALCAGPNRFSDEMNLEGFKDQVQAYQDLGAFDSLGKVIWFMAQGWTSTHPMPVNRARELMKWVDSGEYQRVLDGHYPKAA